MIREMHIFVSGLVQGVGFRAAVKRHAFSLGVKGYVRNLSDGRVEICAQGTEEQLKTFLKIVESEPGRGKVLSFETQFRQQREDFHTFEVV